MDATVKMRVVNWKADLVELEALAAFANLGDSPHDWRAFQQQWPNFFPTNENGYPKPGFRTMSEWIYTFAEEWAKDFASDPVAAAYTVPSLLWYRNCLRAVWARNDPYGYNMAVLLGFGREAGEIARKHPDIRQRLPVRPLLIPGQSPNPSEQGPGGLPPSRVAIGLESLPAGRTLIDGVSGEISWEFDWTLQRALYTLTRQRWRAMVCPQCGKHFIADKTAQKHCSTRCYGEAKRQKARDRWDDKGRAEREAKRKQQARSSSKHRSKRR